MTRSHGQQRGPPAPPAGVDAICDEFEAAWRAGNQPRIEDFLRHGDPVHEGVLLRELLLAEWDLRRRHGQHIELEAYHGRFPQSRISITNLWRLWNESHSQCVPTGLAVRSGTVRDGRNLEEPGTVIDRYQLLEKLGEGGFGTVWVAEQYEPVRRRVALKLIKLGMDTKQVVARFEAERQMLAFMDHPNIAKVLDAGITETGRPYFVMELVDGVPITDYCDQRDLTTRERLELFTTVCQAVQHAHQKGIIHRDLKPSNVLVVMQDGQPAPKVIDFGIAKATQGGLTVTTIYTHFAQLIGTPAYMSPEQVEMSPGAPGDIDTRSDIYSLGVLLYELLVGITPFDAKELMATGLDEMRRIIREREPTRPSSRLRTLGGEDLTATAKRRGTEPLKLVSLLRDDLDWIVVKCLEKDRTRRYGTAKGLAMDLRRHLENKPVMARPPSKAYLLRKLILRNRGPVLSAFLLLLVLGGGVIGTTWGLIRAKQAHRNAVSAQRAEVERAEGERRAKEEALKRLAQIEKATEILAAVFRDFDPTVAENKGVTLHTLLARQMSDAALQLEGEAVGDPLVVARLQYVLGISLRKLGHLDQAMDVLAKACQTRERLLGADHLDSAATKQQLALLYQSQAKYALAETLHHEVLATRTSKLGPDHRDTLTSRHQLAILYKSQGKYALAESLYKEVLAIRTAKLGADHIETVDTQYSLGALYQADGKNVLAENLYKAVLAIRTSTLGANHPDTIVSRDSLASLYWSMKRLDQSIPLLEESLILRKAELGPDHPETLKRQVTLGANYCDAGRFADGIAFIEQVLQKGGQDPHPAWVRSVLLTAYVQAQKTKEATALVMDRVREARQQFPADSPALAAALADDGKALLEATAYADAEPLLRESLLIGEKKTPDVCGTHHVRSLLGASLLGQRKHAEAEPLLLDGYQGLRQTEAQIPSQFNDVWLPRALDRLVQLYDDWGKPDEAAKWRKERDPARAAHRPNKPTGL